jgi:hypothetical protein
MDLTKLTDKIKEALNKFLGIFPALFSKVFPIAKKQPVETTREKGPPVLEKLQSLLTVETVSKFLNFLSDRFLHRFPEKTRRPILFGFGGLLVLFLILIISLPGIYSGRQKKSVPTDTVVGFSISSDELFIPTEPDFIPEFLLEREARSFWSLEDIRPYWKIPDNEEFWKDEVKSVVDKLMEGVP